MRLGRQMACMNGSAIRCSVLLVLLSACGGDDSPKSKVLTDADLVPLIDSSGAVFVGKVIARGARTTAAVRASRLTAIVEISALPPAESLSLIRVGDRVTLLVVDTTSLLENTSYGFLANVLALDTGVVLREVARLDASTPSAQTSALNRMRAARLAAEDGRFQRRLEDAPVVVLGFVQSVDPAAPDSVLRQVEGEGAPHWQIGRVAVRYWWRRDTTMVSSVVAFYFPGSSHVSFATAPRLTKGDSGIFVGHRETLPRELRGGGDSTGLFLTHILDVRAVAESSTVTRLAPPAGAPPRSR